MKKILLISPLLFFVVFKIHSQNTELKGSFSFNENRLYHSSKQKLLKQLEDVDSIKIAVEAGKIISIIKVDNDARKVYYKYWDFDKEDSLNVTKYNNDKVFSLPIEDFISNTTPVYSRYKGVIGGVYTVPFRLRGFGKDFDFESSLSLQSNLVFGFGTKSKQESWVDASVGIGLTGVNLTQSNSVVTTNRTASALTISLGGVWKPAKEVNLGVFIGWDFLGARDRQVDWKYNGDTWIGLGINISFNAIKDPDNSKVGTQ